MNQIFWRNISAILLGSGGILLIVTLYFAHKYDYISLLKFYFKQKKEQKKSTFKTSYVQDSASGNGYIHEPYEKQNDYAQKSTATIRIIKAVSDTIDLSNSDDTSAKTITASTTTRDITMEKINMTVPVKRKDSSVAKTELSKKQKPEFRVIENIIVTNADHKTIRNIMIND